MNGKMESRRKRVCDRNSYTESIKKTITHKCTAGLLSARQVLHRACKALIAWRISVTFIRTPPRICIPGEARLRSMLLRWDRQNGLSELVELLECYGNPVNPCIPGCPIPEFNKSEGVTYATCRKTKSVKHGNTSWTRTIVI